MNEMKKTDWLLVIVIPLVFTLVPDLYTKYSFCDDCYKQDETREIIPRNEDVVFIQDEIGDNNICDDRIPESEYGFAGVKFGIECQTNSGIILSTFSDLPQIQKVVSLSTVGAILIFIFIMIQMFLPFKMLALRAGISLLLGSILGNVADRILNKKVTDFLFIQIKIPWDQGFSYKFIWNFADAFQWVGCAIIIIYLLKGGSILWPIDNLRKKYISDKEYQFKYCIRMMLFVMAFAVVTLVYSYTFLSVLLTDFESIPNKKDFIFSYVIIHIILSVIFVGVMGYIGLILSHRTVGPLFAFERFLKGLISGKKDKLEIRKGDYVFGRLNKIASDFEKEFEKTKQKSHKS